MRAIFILIGVLICVNVYGDLPKVNLQPTLIEKVVVNNSTPDASGVAYVHYDDKIMSVHSVIARDSCSLYVFAKRAYLKSKEGGASGCVKVVVYTMGDTKSKYTRRATHYFYSNGTKAQ